MQDAFYDFDWTVAPRYEWQEFLDTRGQPFRVPSDGILGLESPSAVEATWNSGGKHGARYGPVLSPVIRDEETLRHYHPMHRENAALFREFSEVDYTSTDEIKTFAVRYGLLGVGMESSSVRYRAKDGELYDHHAHGEMHLRWALEICFMREGIRSASRVGSLKDLKRLKWLFDRNLQHVQGRLGFHQSGEPRLMLEPLTLIAAMWLQLALAVTGEKRFEACKFCRRMFEISTEQSGFRSHREFCSDSCKTKDYRKRKRTALRLATEGKTLADISAKTETAKATVRAWLKAPGRYRREKPGDA